MRAGVFVLNNNTHALLVGEVPRQASAHNPPHDNSGCFDSLVLAPLAISQFYKPKKLRIVQNLFCHTMGLACPDVDHKPSKYEELRRRLERSFKSCRVATVVLEPRMWSAVCKGSEAEPSERFAKLAGNHCSKETLKRAHGSAWPRMMRTGQ
eukprot:1189869-Amphidinium_carterae.1